MKLPIRITRRDQAPQESAPPSRLVAALLLVMAIAGIGVEIAMIRVFLGSLAVQRWPTAQGTIRHSELTTQYVMGSGTRYEAKIRYDYSVNGQSFSSSTVRTRGEASERQFDIEGLVKRYPVGKVVTVFYGPDDPAKSYLEAGPDVINYVLIISPIVFAALFGLGFLDTLRRLRAAKGTSEAVATPDEAN